MGSKIHGMYTSRCPRMTHKECENKYASYLQMPPAGRLLTSPLIPGAAMLPAPPQHFEVAAFRSAGTRFCVPFTASVTAPLQYIQMSAPRRRPAGPGDDRTNNAQNVRGSLMVTNQCIQKKGFARRTCSMQHRYAPIEYAFPHCAVTGCPCTEKGISDIFLLLHSNVHQGERVPTAVRIVLTRTQLLLAMKNHPTQQAWIAHAELDHSTGFDHRFKIHITMASPPCLISMG